MSLVIAVDTIDKFKQTTRYDVGVYLNLWVTFMDTSYKNLVDYFNGKTNNLEQDTIKNLAELVKENTRVDDVLSSFAENLERYDFWNLVEYLDEIGNKISYITSISKFLRSAKYEGFNESSLAIERIMADYDIPDSIASEKSNPSDEWTDIFIKNNVLESDYKAEQGGLKLSVGKSSLNNLFVNSVIDNLVGDNLYGKDMDAEFVFADDDLKVLTPRDTVKQSVKILANLGKGDIPQFPDLGVTKSTLIGSNLGIVSVPFLTRELKESFASDDTLVNFVVTDVKLDGSALFLEFEVQTFNDFIIQESIKI